MGVNEFIQIGSKIKEYRNKKGVTQKKMAELLEIPYSTYSNYENNREPKGKQLQEIADSIARSNTSEDAKTLNGRNSTIPDWFYELTIEELQDIMNYAEFVKSKRDSDFKALGKQIKKISNEDIKCE